MKRLLVLGIVLAGFSHSLWAEPILSGPWHFGASAGGAFPDVENSHINTGPGWPEDDYRVAHVDGTGIFSAFAGYTWEREQPWFPFFSFDINYFYANSTDVEGKIQQYSLPQFENYSFKYKLKSQLLLGTLKVDLYRYKNIMPFLTAGLGGAWNTVEDYDEHVFSGNTARVSPAFSDHTNASLAYLFGAGFDVILDRKLWLSAQWNWADLGRAKSGESEAYEDNLNSRVSSNNVLLSLTYYFGDNDDDDEERD